MASDPSTAVRPASVDVASDLNGGLDPARTALVLVHMVKGVASPLWRTLFDCVCLMEGTAAVEVIDDVAPAR